jgi:hypothetical protein
MFLLTLTMKLILLNSDLGYETDIVEYSLSYVDDKVKLVPQMAFTLTFIYSRFLNAKLDGMLCIQEISTISNEIIIYFYGKYSWKLINGLQKSIFLGLYGLTFDQLNAQNAAWFKVANQTIQIFSILSL